jgi:hypothetical protein
MKLHQNAIHGNQNITREDIKPSSQLNPSSNSNYRSDLKSSYAHPRSSSDSVCECVNCVARRGGETDFTADSNDLYITDYQLGGKARSSVSESDQEFINNFDNGNEDRYGKPLFYRSSDINSNLKSNLSSNISSNLNSDLNSDLKKDIHIDEGVKNRFLDLVVAEIDDSSADLTFLEVLKQADAISSLKGEGSLFEDGFLDSPGLALLSRIGEGEFDNEHEDGFSVESLYRNKGIGQDIKKDTDKDINQGIDRGVDIGIDIDAHEENNKKHIKSIDEVFAAANIDLPKLRTDFKEIIRNESDLESNNASNSKPSTKHKQKTKSNSVPSSVFDKSKRKSELKHNKKHKKNSKAQKGLHLGVEYDLGSKLNSSSSSSTEEAYPSIQNHKSPSNSGSSTISIPFVDTLGHRVNTDIDINDVAIFGSSNTRMLEVAFLIADSFTLRGLNVRIVDHDDYIKTLTDPATSLKKIGADRTYYIVLSDVEKTQVDKLKLLGDLFTNKICFKLPSLELKDAGFSPLGMQEEAFSVLNAINLINKESFNLIASLDEGGFCVFTEIPEIAGNDSGQILEQTAKQRLQKELNSLNVRKLKPKKQGVKQSKIYRRNIR